MTQYITPEHPDAFVDFPGKKPKENWNYKGQELAECPKCYGYGGWNLTLNAYRLPPAYEDTPENRHRFVHFQAACFNCHGWGWMPAEETDHIHDFKEISREAAEQRGVNHYGMCYHVYVCSVCDKVKSVDSSD